MLQVWEDGSISVIGRQQELMRIGDVDVCAVDIENTISADDEVLDCLVVPVHDDGGNQVPVALLTLSTCGARVDEGTTGRLKAAVHKEHGEQCVPLDFVRVGAIPRTFSSKPMRQVVRQLFAGVFDGDVSEIANPSCMDTLSTTIADWLAVRLTPVLDEYC